MRAFSHSTVTAPSQHRHSTGHAASNACIQFSLRWAGRRVAGHLVQPPFPLPQYCHTTIKYHCTVSLLFRTVSLSVVDPLPSPFPTSFLFQDDTVNVYSSCRRVAAAGVREGGGGDEKPPPTKH